MVVHYYWTPYTLDKQPVKVGVSWSGRWWQLRQQVLNEAGTDEKCNLHGLVNAGCGKLCVNDEMSCNYCISCLSLFMFSSVCLELYLPVDCSLNWPRYKGKNWPYSYTGGITGGALCQPSSDKTGFCVKHMVHIFKTKSWVVKWTLQATTVCRRSGYELHTVQDNSHHSTS